MKKEPLTRPALILLILVVLILPFGVALSGEFTNDKDLYFTGTSGSAGSRYTDVLGGNLDVGMQLCGVGQRYVGAFYALSVSSAWSYALVSYGSSTDALAFTSNDLGNSCYTVSPAFVTVSPSELTTPDPDVKVAAFPGRLFIGYSASANPGNITNFTSGGVNASLLGSYDVNRSFSQSTRQVTMYEPTITFESSSGSFTKVASNSGATGYGIDDTYGRRMVAGVCDVSDGTSCSDGTVFTSSSFPATFSTGLSAVQVSDQSTYTRYVVINGLGYSMCIGANLQGAITLIDPDPTYYSQTLTINYTISNPRDTPYETDGGNVNVTTAFEVNITIYNGSGIGALILQNITNVTTDLEPNQTLSRSFTWPAYATSGNYTVRISVDDDNSIAECDEGDNLDTDTFELRPITVAQITIDGAATTAFAYANLPYNLSINLKNSDNNTMQNATIYLVEENGLSLTAPTQLENRSVSVADTVQDGVRTQTKVRIRTNYLGNASLLFIPTYNKLFLAQYNYTNLSAHIGNYALYLEGEQRDGNTFKFISNGNVVDTYNFSISNFSSPAQITDKRLKNEIISSQIMDFVYQTYANFLDTIIG